MRRMIPRRKRSLREKINKKKEKKTTTCRERM